ncbi:protein of unknown function [Candidatus Nitrospira inopinata]|uniref:Uncharacterized protein n=1 Tax=Candidatus Nitrospira inopinata TaxID=1715989 RepID=A0A0S4KSP1_9BACT|nr:protein of unknown function [Candidatus Nitrospira inopinata]
MSRLSFRFSFFASMGPRRFSRGNADRSVDTTAKTLGFNGAAAFQPRKSLEGVDTLLFENPLQWGRGVSAAEIGSECAQKSVEARASMGPRRFSRGNGRTRQKNRNANRCFNGAAAFQPRKSRCNP